MSMSYVLTQFFELCIIKYFVFQSLLLNQEFIIGRILMLSTHPPPPTPAAARDLRSHAPERGGGGATANFHLFFDNFDKNLPINSFLWKVQGVSGPLSQKSGTVPLTKPHIQNRCQLYQGAVAESPKQQMNSKVSPIFVKCLLISNYIHQIMVNPNKDRLGK